MLPVPPAVVANEALRSRVGYSTPWWPPFAKGLPPGAPAKVHGASSCCDGPLEFWEGFSAAWDVAIGASNREASMAIAREANVNLFTGFSPRVSNEMSRSRV